MARTVINGGSDDLIEFSGSFSEEYDASRGGDHVTLTLAGGGKLAFFLAFRHPGIWRFGSASAAPAFTAEPAREDVAEGATGNDDDGCPAYSEKLVVEDKILSVSIRPATAEELAVAYPFGH